MKIIRTVALLLAFTVITGCFAGCHGTNGVDAVDIPKSLDTSKNIELTFWAKNDTNKNQVAAYDKAVSDFHKLYPNITVTTRYYTDYEKIYQDVITNIPTLTMPDVCITFPDHIATYKTGQNVVVPLDSLISNKKYGLGGSELPFESVKKEEIVSEYLNECYLDGVCYALPFVRSTEACYINKTYVEKLGFKLPVMLTWDFIWEVSEKATEKDADGKFKVNGQDIMIPFIYKSTDNMMIQMLWQKGAEYSDSEGNIKIFNDTAKDILYDVAKHTKTGAFSTFKVSGYPANFLNAGQCIFAIDSTAGSTWMGSDAPLCDISEDKIVKFETAVRPVPQFDTEHPLMMSQGPSVCVLNNGDSQRVLAAWLFTQYLLTNDVQLSYSETEGYIPVTNKALESKEYKEYLSLCGSDNEAHYRIKIEAVKMLIDHRDDTFITAVFNGSDALRQAASDMIERVTKSVRRKETVDDAYFEAMFKDIPVKYHFGT